ncbi:hypothetical protein Pint_16957 [Pistacia integerrima]|uniref:Uncharacterized protein n=1 Tax=Pistacia integerrima TaxID=434235 RepID=A0ACC0Z8U4_9ROSI|nr:hypothetical protein Pint_16957 [Pistacia integerrima]
MAESIVFGIATEILKKIGSLVGGELSLLWNLDSDLRRLQRTMSAIKAVLLDAETKQTQNHQLRDWLGKLKDVFYDVEDVLDEFDFQASRRSQQGSSTLKLEKLPGNIRRMISLRHVEITTKERNLVRLFEGMQDLTSLRRLDIQFLDLPQLILQGSANTLQCIMIENCPKLKELPEWLQNLTSLQTLEILNCRSLSCLPEGMQRLTVLRQLKIQGCPALSETCRRDQSKIAHVREVHLDE